MSATLSADSLRIVIAGAGPAAQALVRRLTSQPGPAGGASITVLSNRDDSSEALLELAGIPQVSVRFGQPASHIDANARTVATADGMEFAYDHLVIATGSEPALPPIAGSNRALGYSTIDDAGLLGEAVKDITRVVGRRPLGLLVGTGPSAGQAEAVLRARGVRPVRTTLRPAAVVPSIAGSALPAMGIVFEDGSRMNGDLVVLAEERAPRSDLAESAGLETAPDGGIAVGRDLAASVRGIWAIGDAASCDGLRLGLLLSAEAAAMLCASGLLLDGLYAGRQAPLAA